MDENRKLRRQSLLIAFGCVIGDGAPFLLGAAQRETGPAVWLVGAAILLADLALALPARTAGPVAVVHGIVRFAAAAVLLAVTGVHDNGIGNSTGLVVAGYRAGAWVDGYRSWVALAALAAGLSATQVLQGYDAAAGNILLALTNTVIPFLLGRHTTGRSGYIAEVQRRAEQQRRDAAQALTTAVETERADIARDLHDTISHHVSAVGVHAAAARLGMKSGLPTHQERTIASLEQVETSSRSALNDLRRMLDLLHGNESDGVRQPGLGALDDLVEGIRRTGSTVNLRVDGLDPPGLPSSLNLTAYRTVQELLTNALRHGDGVVDLSIVQTRVTLRITSANTISRSAGPSPGTGRGLDGIRHRVTLFAGSAVLGPAPDTPGVWRADLTFPIEESR
ncbi:two-component sensor histidine kinase [Actinoplanes philippinensis]|uniref:histidine kinase n=1 Tax=Actinoplanes philippinensis TaxID=35752 RepID=A0A1I2N8X3_9ACTN|nr:histidine kinase [Actinoplanes philippinensis]GIE76294.1 two-component sensor histidine kinase [Actinoplanes philippinensis]SFF98157.1 Histidine kinase [Actinoplanes philippinensis]